MAYNPYNRESHNLPYSTLLQPYFSITLGGRHLFNTEYLQYVEEVQVEEEENKLTIATIVVQDSSFLWNNSGMVKKNEPVVITLGHKSKYRTMLRGKITHIDADFQSTGIPQLNIICTDSAVSMQDKPKTESFRDKKVSDVVKEKLKSRGFKYDVTDTKVRYPYVTQSKETDLDFIFRWADKLGWYFYRMENGNYYFGPRNPTAHAIATLSYKTGGQEIQAFTPAFAEPETDDYGIIESDIASNGTTVSAKYAKLPYGSDTVLPVSRKSSPSGKARAKSKR